MSYYQYIQMIQVRGLRLFLIKSRKKKINLIFFIFKKLLKDGYQWDDFYGCTQMHTDSTSLIKERSTQPMNSTFLLKDDDSEQQQQQTKSFIDTLKKNNKKLTKPSPPLRSSSVMSNSSTLNNSLTINTKNHHPQSISNYEQDLQDSSSVCSDATLSGHTNTYNTNSSSQQLNSLSDNLPTANGLTRIEQNLANHQQQQQVPSITSPSPANTWCSSSINSDIDLVKLRNKTAIEAQTAYPSMVAYPDSELSSISSFGNLAFAQSGNHRCTVISKSRSTSDNQQFANYNLTTTTPVTINQYSNTSSYSNGHHHSRLSKKDSTSSLDSKLSKRSLSTIGSYASLTKLKELLKPLRNTLIGQKSSEKKLKQKESDNTKKKSKDDCLIDETAKSNKRKGFFTRFGSINRGKIVKSNHLEKIQNQDSKSNEIEPQDDLIKLRNTINKWRIEPVNSQDVQMNKVLNKNNTKELSKQHIAEEDENEYYAKLSQQSTNILRNSVDYSFNNELKRFSIASNNSQNCLNTNFNSYLHKNHPQQQMTSTINDHPLSHSLNQPASINQSLNFKENRKSDTAIFTKLFPISRYTSKVQPEEHHQFLVPSLPTPTYYENLPSNTRFSYASDSGCSNSLALSNNSNALYASIPSRPKTLNLSASLSTSFNNQPIYSGQTMLSNSYNCSFNPYYTNNVNYQLINNTNNNNVQSLNSSISSYYSNNNNNSPPHQILTHSNMPLTSNFNNVNVLNNHLNQASLSIHHQNSPHQQQQQISSSSSHQSTSSSSYNYLSSTASSLVNTPSSISSSPFHQLQQQQQQQQQTSQMNQIKVNNNQSKNNQPSSIVSTNTAIVSPFCKIIQNSTDSLKKSEEKLNKKLSIDDSNLNRTLNHCPNQIIFRDSMRLTRAQREQTLARIQRSSWTPSSNSMMSSSSPSGSLGSSGSNGSSTDQSVTCNDINKLINELSNFNEPNECLNQDKANRLQKLPEIENHHQINHQMINKSDPIYGVNIARTRFSYPLIQNENAMKGNLNVLKQQQSNNTNINDFKKLLTNKEQQINGDLSQKKSASEQLKVTRKPLSALSALEKLNGDNCISQTEIKRRLSESDFYEKETYDNVTDEENENRSTADFKSNATIISLVNGQQANGFATNNLRTRVINGRIYKTPFLFPMYPPINEEENTEDTEFLVANNQQKTSTWV